MTRVLVSGTDQVQLPADSTGKRVGYVKTAIGAAGSEIYLIAPSLVDDAGNTIDALTSVPVGTERGLAVRQVGPAIVGGSAASGAAAAGNPVPIGGQYRAVNITLADGQTAYASLDTAGRLQVNAALIQGATVPGNAAASNVMNIGVADATPNTVRVLQGPIAGSISVSIASGAASIAKAEDTASVDGDVGVPLLLRRLDATQPAAAQTTTDADYTFGIADSKGRQRVTVVGESVGGEVTQAGVAVITTPPTNVTGSNTTGVIISCGDAGNVTLTAQGTGTFGTHGGVLAFQASRDGTNWVAVQGTRLDTSIGESFSMMGLGGMRAWSFEMGAFQYFRAYLVVAPSGGTTPAWTLVATPGGLIYDPVPSPVAPQSARVPVNYYSEAYAVTTTDTLVTITGVQRAGGASGTGQLTVTVGKTLRVQKIIYSLTAVGTTVTNTRLRMRVGFPTTGQYPTHGAAAALTSPIVAIDQRLGGPTAPTAAGVIGVWEHTFTEGIDIPSLTGIQFAAIATTASMHTLDVILKGYEF